MDRCGEGSTDSAGAAGAGSGRIEDRKRVGGSGEHRSAFAYRGGEVAVAALSAGSHFGVCFPSLAMGSPFLLGSGSQGGALALICGRAAADRSCGRVARLFSFGGRLEHVAPRRVGPGG